MSVYYWIIVWIAFFAILSSMAGMKQQEILCGEKVYRYRWSWALIAVIPIIYITATRGYVGDTATYMKSFAEMPETFGEFSEYISGITKDKGFYAFSAVLKIIFGNDVKIYFLILAIIQMMILVKIYRKYSPQFVLSIFLFLISTDYISWMFNGIRQFMAVTITFLACPLILKKKYVPAIILILFASAFHGTALLMLPFIFIVQGKAWNKKTLFFIAATIVIISFIGEFTTVLDTLLQDTQYQNVVSDWQEWQDDGTNVLRVLVYSVPMLFSMIGIKHIKAADNPVINMCTNMTIISVGFYVVSMFTSGIFIGRLPIYFSLYNYILLPWEIENMFTRDSQKLIYVGMFIGYILFYLYSIRAMGL